ncbi:MAG: M20/M25/M40 family metallo-hydrolase [Armatimonadetes bacterium]|nr:M20/M25/M40 family metallo-hydrolase [Armatimonadota bacterium]
MVNEERLVRSFLDLVKINSPSKCERGVVDYLQPKLKELGFEVREDDAGKRIGGNAGNLIATMQGRLEKGLRLFLSAHMDTVEPTEGIEPVVTEDGIIRSNGRTILGADDKAGVAAILEAARVVVEKDVPFHSLQIVFSIAEEIGIMGAKEVSASDISADAGYVFDTEKPVAGVVVSAPSHENLLVKVFGKAAHAGIHPEDGTNAIIAASKAIADMKLGRIDEETTANVGVINGGKARNIVPDEVEVLAEARSRNEAKLAAQVEHMVRLFHDAAKEIGAGVDIEVKREYTTYRWTPEDAPVKLAQRAARTIGIEAEMINGGGGSDANIYNEKGVPAVVIGVGYGGAHSREEHIAIADLVKAAEFAVSLISESGAEAE